jgi:hypothetical protein
MSRNIRPPQRFRDWGEYEDRYNVEVVAGPWVMRCRSCGAEWAMPHNRGKLGRGAHVCPNECNGKRKQKRSAGTQPPMLRRHLEELRRWRGERDDDRRWEEAGVRADGGEWEDGYEPPWVEARREAKRRQKLWFTVRSVKPSTWADLDRLWEEAADQTDPLAWIITETGRRRSVRRSQTDE